MDPAASARIAKLDDVLRQLPSTYQDRGRLRSDVAALLQTIPSLTPDKGTFSGGGRQVTLFYLTGVVPISFRSSTYNIPVTIYFDDPYPRVAPRCFVTPTQGMALKTGHANVDQGGMIYLPYLSTWNGRSSSLSELMGIIASAFSADPPVYSVASSASSQPAAAVQRPVAQAVAAVVAVAAQPAGGYPVAVAKAVAQPPVQAQPTPEECAVRALTEQAKTRWPEVLKPIIDETNEQGRRKVELQARANEVDAAISNLEAATKDMESKEAELRSIETQLESFVQANAGKEPDPDSLKDELDQDSRLVLDLLSEELGMEEYLSALDELLEARKVPIDDFMREVREASREQFKLRVQRQKAAKTVREGVGTSQVQAQAVQPAAVNPATPAAVAAAVPVQAVPVSSAAYTAPAPAVVAVAAPAQPVRAQPKRVAMPA